MESNKVPLVFQIALQSGPKVLYLERTCEFLDELFLGFQINGGNLRLIHELLLYKGYDYERHYFKSETEERQLELVKYFEDASLHMTIFAPQKLFTNDMLAKSVSVRKEGTYHGDLLGKKGHIMRICWERRDISWGSVRKEGTYHGDLFVSADQWKAFLGHCSSENPVVHKVIIEYAIITQLDRMKSPQWLGIVLKWSYERGDLGGLRIVWSRLGGKGGQDAALWIPRP
jgi:hypothetical protein